MYQFNDSCNLPTCTVYTRLEADFNSYSVNTLTSQLDLSLRVTTSVIDICTVFGYAVTERIHCLWEPHISSIAESFVIQFRLRRAQLWLFDGWPYSKGSLLWSTED